MQLNKYNLRTFILTSHQIEFLMHRQFLLFLIFFSMVSHAQEAEGFQVKDTLKLSPVEFEQQLDSITKPNDSLFDNKVYKTSALDSISFIADSIPEVEKIIDKRPRFLNVLNLPITKTEGSEKYCFGYGNGEE